MGGVGGWGGGGVGWGGGWGGVGGVGWGGWGGWGGSGWGGRGGAGGGAAGRGGAGLSAGMRTSFSTLTVSPRPPSGSFEVIRVALNGTEVHVQGCRLLELGVRPRCTNPRSVPSCLRMCADRHKSRSVPRSLKRRC